MSQPNVQPIIKKIKKVAGHGHHGGAWKVAYADFVTAMMAFFLLMWLLNATTEEQKRGLSNYFGPPGSASGNGGSGGVLGGTTVKSEGLYDDSVSTGDGSNEGEDEGTKGVTRDSEESVKNTAKNNEMLKINDETSKAKDDGKASDPIQKATDRLEAENFKDVKDALKQALEQMPELKDLAKHLIIDETPEGLRIQIVDQNKASMFNIGDATPLPQTLKLLEVVAKVITKIPNKISVTGHTDSTQYKRTDYTNWELSADRANSSRRALEKFGLDPARMIYVTGKADTEPFVKNDPKADQNRRISIILHRMNRVVTPTPTTSTTAGNAVNPEATKK